MLPLIERVCVKEKKWITDEEMTDIPAIAESSPGPVAVNCATFVGYKRKGAAGAAVAALGMVIPSFMIIFIISLFFDRFLENRWVSGAFYGIKIAVGILIIDAAIRLFTKLPKNILTVATGAVSFLLMMAVNIFALRITSIVLMLFSAVTGLAVYLIGKKRKGGKAV